MKIDIDIKDIPGCVYTVDGERCGSLQEAVQRWVLRGTDSYDLVAWCDGSKVAWLPSPWANWVYYDR